MTYPGYDVILSFTVPASTVPDGILEHGFETDGPVVTDINGLVTFNFALTTCATDEAGMWLAAAVDKAMVEDRTAFDVDVCS